MTGKRPVPSTRQGGPTSRDIAGIVGVSQSAVSLVLSGRWKGRVSPATAEKIQRAANAAGYVPNAAARSLRSGRSQLVALLVPDVTNPFFSAVLQGAHSAAEDLEHMVLLSESDDRPGGLAAKIAKLSRFGVDGLIIASIHDDDKTNLIPSRVYIDSPNEIYPTIDIGNVSAIFRSVKHLVDLGHTRLLHASGPLRHAPFAQRQAGFRSAISTCGLDLNEQIEVTSGIRIDEAKEAILAALGNDRGQATAIVCDDDILAAGAYAATAELGLSVPSDVSITGFDDIALASTLTPPLTTVKVPAEHIGREAMRILHEQISGERPVVESVSLRCELIVRGSTTNPPANAAPSHHR